MVSNSKALRLPPLSLILIVPYALQIIAVVGLVGWLSYQSGQETIESLASEVSKQATNRINERLETLLQRPQSMVVANTFYYKQQQISLDSPLKLQEHFRQQIVRHSPMVPVVYAGDSKGQYLLVNKTQVETSSPSEPGKRIIYTLDGEGKRGGVIGNFAYDPRQRPWYRAAIQDVEPIWTQPYLFASGGMGISVTNAIRDKAGQVQAVVAADVSLDIIEQYLRKIRFSKSSRIFIVDSSGAIVADSLPKISSSKSATKTERELQKLTSVEIRDPVIRESRNYLQNNEDRINSITPSSNIELRIQDRKYFLNVLPFQFGKNLSWQVAIAFSEQDFAQQIERNNRTTFILSVLALILSITVGMMTSRFLTQRILRLAKAVDKIDLGETKPLPFAHGGTQEMDVLVDSFERMIVRLRDMLKELEEQAYVDKLTGLSNRAAFLVHLQSVIVAAKKANHPTFAVLLLELDSLKWIESGLGLGTANLLLKESAARLQNCLEAIDAQIVTIARIERNEFAILLGNIVERQTAIKAAQMIVNVFKQPFTLNQKDVVAQAHVGVVVEHGEVESPEDILRNANIARLSAKVSGQTQYVLFDKPMLLSTAERLQFEADLQYAVDRNEFELFYQPILSVKAAGVAGFEALIRWQHPRLGFVSPAQFIEVAEETGAIAKIGAWVLQTACKQLKTWQQEIPTLRSAYISVNVSVQQLLLPNYVEQVEQTVMETGIEGQYIQLEITESAALSQPEIIAQKLSRLKKLGLQVCFDDFGTGYSQLSHLVKLPVDALKIDRSFVSYIGTQDLNSEIATTIIALSTSLQLDVTAEGVETIEQYHYLRSLGCDKFQGYLFSPPVKSQEISHFCPVMPDIKIGC